MSRQGFRHRNWQWRLSVFIIIAVLTTLSLKAFAQTPNTWVQKANLGGVARAGAIGFSIGSKGYFGTGSSASNSTLSDFWEYDPVLNTWTQRANFGGGGRTDAVGFSIGTKGYIGTGGNGSTLFNDLWEYDPAANNWLQKASFGGAPREGAVGFSMGTKGYIGTGTGAGGPYSDFWEFTPATNSWAQKAAFAGNARYYATGLSIGGKGYVGFGGSNIPPIYPIDFWEYDLAANSWTPKASFGGNRTNAPGFSIGSKGYIGTGASNATSTNLSDFWEYDPSVNTWTQRASFGGGIRRWGIGFSIGSKGYLGSGNNGPNVYFNDFWEYTPPLFIYTGVINGSSFCAGDTANIPFTTNNNFTSGNIFTAQLSDGLGSFASPTNIGSIAGITSGVISTIIPVNAPAGTGYRIRVISSNPVVIGMDNGSNLAINTAIPTSIAITTPYDTVCVSFPVTFTAVGVNGGSSPVYHWKRNGINIGTNSPSLTYTPANHDTITCTLTSSLTCAIPPTDTSNAIVLTVNPPNLNVVPTSATFCEGDSIILKAVDSTTIGLNYQWQINSNNIAGATTYHYTVKTTGAYTLVFNIGNCTAGSVFIPVNVWSAPIPFIHLLPGGKMQTDFYNSYQWNFNDTAIAGATSISYIAAKNGAYTVTVTDPDGCTGTSVKVHFPWVGIGMVNALNEGFSLYPNPASGEVSMTLPAGINDASVIRVLLFDITGKRAAVLYEGRVARLRKGNTLTLPSVTMGLYIVKFEVDGYGTAVRLASGNPIFDH